MNRVYLYNYTTSVWDIFEGEFEHDGKFEFDFPSDNYVDASGNIQIRVQRYVDGQWVDITSTTDATVYEASQTGSYIKMDEDGIQAYNGTEFTFTIDKNGNVSLKGQITASSGSIGGWNIASNQLSSQNNALIMNGQTGSIQAANGTASISSSGITATAGTIGGWAISSSDIHYGNIYITNTALWLGNTAKTSANIVLNNDGSAKIGKLTVNTNGSITTGTGFTVNTDGSITATSGSIGGWTIGTSTLSKNNIILDSTGVIKAGTANQITISATNGINVNNKFTVDLNGNMTAIDANITGKITATEGSFTGTLNIADTGKIIAGSGVGSYVAIDNTGIYIEHNDNGNITKEAAITSQGIYGRLLTDNSVIWDAFDKIAPAAPSWRGLTSYSEVTANGEVVSIDLKWNAPTLDSNSQSLMDLGGYIIYQSNDYNDVTGTGSFYPIATIDADAHSPKIETDDAAVVVTNIVNGKEFAILANPSYRVSHGLKPNSRYWFKICAFDKQGNISQPSTIESVTTSKDSIAPNKPLVPTVVPGLRSILVELHPASEQNPALIVNDYDIDHFIIERHTEGITEDFTFSIRDRRFLDSALYLVDGSLYNGSGEVDYTKTYSYRCKAIDTSGNESEWSDWSVAVTPSQVGRGDLVADSVTAMQLNIGAMVKSINTKETVLFHFDGTLQSTQGLTPYTEEVGNEIIVHQAGFFKKEAKFGASLAIEEETINLIALATNHNANFARDTSGWTIGSGIFHAVNGADGVQDGYIDVFNDNTNYCTVNLEPGTYTISLYAKGYDAKVTVQINNEIVIDESVTSLWDRYIGHFTITEAAIVNIYLKTSTAGKKVSVDSVQLEARAYATSFVNGNKPEGYVDYYGPAIINLSEGVISFWIKSIIGWHNVTNNDHSIDPYIDYWFTYGNPNETNSIWAKYDREHAQLTVSYNDAIMSYTFGDIDDWVHFALAWKNGLQQLYINGEVVATGTASSIIEVSDDLFRLGYWPRITDRVLEEYEEPDIEKMSRASALIDELRIDNVIRHADEILSWYKQSSSFYDAAAQIDADSQNITAANASVVINNEGIKITDGKLEVVSSDGQVLITGGRLKVDGLDIGVPQSNNYVKNNYFSISSAIYGYGDAHIEGVDTIINGAKDWRSYRTSGPTMLPTMISFIYNPLKDISGEPVKISDPEHGDITLGVLQYNDINGNPVTTTVWDSLRNVMGLPENITEIPGIIGYVDMSNTVPIVKRVLYFDDTTFTEEPMRYGNTILEFRARSSLYGEPSYARLGVTGTDAESVEIRQHVTDLELRTGPEFKPHVLSCKYHYEDGPNGKVVSPNSKIEMIVDELVSNPVSIQQTDNLDSRVSFQQYYWPWYADTNDVRGLTDPTGRFEYEYLLDANHNPAIGDGTTTTFYAKYDHISDVYIHYTVPGNTVYPTEGIDYTVDTENGIIQFIAPPPEGAQLFISYRIDPLVWTIKREDISPFQDADPNSYNGTYSYTNRIGHGIAYTVYLEAPSDADLYMIMGPEIGIALILVDGQVAGEGDLSWPTRRRSVFRVENFPAGWHTITLVNTGQPGRFTNKQLLESMGQYYWVPGADPQDPVVKKYYSSIAINIMNYDDWEVPDATNPNLNSEATIDQIDFSKFQHIVQIDAPETNDRWLPISITPTYANSTDLSGKPIFKANTKVSYRIRFRVSKDVSTLPYSVANQSAYAETDISQSGMPFVIHNITASTDPTTIYTYNTSILDDGILQSTFFPNVTGMTPTIFDYQNGILIPNTTLTRVQYTIIDGQPVPQFTGPNQYCVITGGHNLPGTFVFSPGTVAENIVFSYDFIIPDTTVVYFTDVQAELGKNMSYGRMPLGMGTIPASWLESYNPAMPRYTGVQWYQLTQYDATTEEYHPYVLTGIRTENLADGAVTTLKIAYSSIIGDHIAQYTINKKNLRYITKIRPNDASKYGWVLFEAVMDGVNTTGYLYILPDDLDDIEIYRNGLLLDSGDDYTATLDNINNVVVIQFTEPLHETDKIIINVWEGGAG